MKLQSFKTLAGFAAATTVGFNLLPANGYEV
jgi:hypothetical protein